MSTIPRQPGSLQEELGKKKPFAAPEQEAFLNILRTYDRLSAAYDRFFKEHGISQPLYNVLRIVQGGGERGVHCQTIANHLITRQPDVTRLVDRVEKLGLVERNRCCEDRRVVWVKITEAGREKIRELEGPVLALHRQQLGHLGSEKLATLNQLLVEARAKLIQEA